MSAFCAICGKELASDVERSDGCCNYCYDSAWIDVLMDGEEEGETPAE